MPPLNKAQLAARVDATVAGLMPKLVEAFDAYKAEGRVFHTPALYGKAERPRGGVEKARPDLTAKTGGQVSWDDAAGKAGARGLFPANFVTDVKVSHYSGPDGDGFVLEVWREFDGVTEKKSVVHGGATWKAHDWQVEVEGPDV